MMVYLLSERTTESNLCSFSRAAEFSAAVDVHGTILQAELPASPAPWCI